VGRLIIVSNRVTPSASDGDESVGGLALALAAALRESPGLWFGWSGRTTPQFSGHLKIDRVGGVTTATVDLEESDLDEYYNGYANKTLWPLFHYRADLAAFDRAYGEGYGRVNARFAATLAPLVEPDDLIWVHDYHLIPMARELRRQGVRNRVGFFLHIPWPAYQVVINLPRHRRLVEALFDYDLVGFQTQDYLQAFEEYVLNEAGGAALAPGLLRGFGRVLRVGVFPVGIDAAAFARVAGSPAAEAMRQRMLAATSPRRLIIGVDRLDYSKGMEERFLGFEQFLAHNADLRRDILMLQIAPVSRDAVQAYQEIRSRLDALSGRINGEYSDVDWAPLRYVNHTYRRDELAGIYAAARVGLVTPLRDGMNLVAKEFVSAQDPEDPGVLILSRFAGAARQLSDALLVNPNSREEVGEALRQALTMERSERIRRWRALHASVVREDVHAWRDAFVALLRRADEPVEVAALASPRQESQDAGNGPLSRCRLLSVDADRTAGRLRVQCASPQAGGEPGESWPPAGMSQ
jgi:trehalose 6-phosphate synthase